MTKVSLIFDKAQIVDVELKRTPYYIQVGNLTMVQITDPDTGEFLGAYIEDKDYYLE